MHTAQELLQQVRETCYDGGQPDYAKIVDLVSGHSEAFKTRSGLVSSVDELIQKTRGLPIPAFLEESAQDEYGARTGGVMARMWWRNIKMHYERMISIHSEARESAGESSESISRTTDELEQKAGEYLCDRFMEPFRGLAEEVQEWGEHAQERVEQTQAEFELSRLYFVAVLNNEGMAHLLKQIDL